MSKNYWPVLTMFLATLLVAFGSNPWYAAGEGLFFLTLILVIKDT